MLAAVGMECQGQDPQFSQFFATRMYINPAFAGNTDFARISSQFRRQWPTVDGYTTYGVYYDHNLWQINSGVGVSMLQDWQAGGALAYKKFALMYAYAFTIKRGLYGRAGLSASYNSYGIDLNRFTFTDQLLSGAPVTIDDYNFARLQYMDFSTGTVVYTKSYWIGASVSNLNNLKSNPAPLTNPFPAKWSAHGGVLVPVNKDVKGNFHQSVTIASHYKAQLKYDQLDLGAYYGFSTLLFGLWYRGLPLLKDNDSEQANTDAVIIVAGLKHEGLRISYSYDITVSALARYSGGAHEATFQLEFGQGRNQKRKKPSKRQVPCPSFGPSWQS